MSDWNYVNIKPLKILDEITDQVPPVLEFLRTVETFLEGVIDFISAFALLSVSPYVALLKLLLKSIKELIASLTGTGVSVLLVYPDYTRKDPVAILNSVKGGLPAFENTISAKMFDYNDLFRPQFPPGSTSAWFVLYINAQSPGDLIKQLRALMRLLQTKEELFNPYVVDVKVLPVLQSESVSAASKLATSLTWNMLPGKEAYTPASLQELLSSDIQNALVVEWSLITAPSALATPGFTNPLAEFLNNYISPFNDFIIERSEKPNGDPVLFTMNSASVGSLPSLSAEDDGALAPPVEASVIEPSGQTFRHFPFKRYVNLSTDVILGFVTGTFRYIDDEVEVGKDYYYRIRIGTGSLPDYVPYLNAEVTSAYNALITTADNVPVINLPNIGPASTVVRGRVPVIDFDILTVATLTAKASLYLNFELLPPDPEDDSNLIRSKTGFGSYQAVASQVALVKSFSPTTVELSTSTLFTSTVNRIVANSVVTLTNQFDAFSRVKTEWFENGMQEIVLKIIEEAESKPYRVLYADQLIDPQTETGRRRINSYLYLEYSGNLDPKNDYVGPIPLTIISVQDRSKLRNFLGILLIGGGTSYSYLKWYGLTLGDFFPKVFPVIRQIERLIESIIKAAEKAIEQIKKVVKNIIQKVKQLELIILQIQEVINALKIELNLGILAGFTTDSSPSSVINAIQSAGNKPVTLNSSYYSGMIGVAAAPGESAVNAIKTIFNIIGVELS